MANTQMDRDRISERGKNLYHDRIRAQVETPNDIGKMVIIDVETGDYEVDQSGLEAARILHARQPNAELYGIRIGYRAADAIGGAMERTTG